jgi:hypothetical protein
MHIYSPSVDNILVPMICGCGEQALADLVQNDFRSMKDSGYHHAVNNAPASEAGLGA